MAAMLPIALTFGALLGLRFNVWALVACLCAAVPATTAVMLISSGTLSAAMLAAFLLVTSMEIGYLAGAYATGVLWRTAQSAPSSIYRKSISR